MSSIDRKSLVPASVWRIYEASAKIPSPVGARFTAKTTNATTKLYLYDLIGEGLSESAVSADAVAKALDEAQASGAKALDVYINSPGGVIADGMSIYNAIRRFKGTRTVYVDGWAASIASVIALAGDRVVSGVGATWMLHEPSGAMLGVGRRGEVRDAWEKFDSAIASMHESILDVYASRTKQPREQLDAWMRAETYMTAAEAKERGFTDEVAECDPDKDEPMPAKQKRAMPAARALTPAEIVAAARADYADLKSRFPEGQPSAQRPGQPGSNASTPVRRQENAR